jgi:hypothetical protein
MLKILVYVLRFFVTEVCWVFFLGGGDRCVSLVGRKHVREKYEKELFQEL